MGTGANDPRCVASCGNRTARDLPGVYPWAQRMRIVFTTATIKALRAEGERTDYWDKSRPSFGLRVAASGLKSWQVMFVSPLDGRRRRSVIAYWPEVGLEEAREKAAAVLRLVEQGHDPVADAAVADQSRKTFGELAADFMRLYSRPRKRSWREDQRQLDRYVLPAWGARWLDTIRRREVVALVDQVATTGPIQARRVLALLSKLFNWAIGRGDLDANPAMRVPKPGAERRRERALNDDEIVRFWRACNEDGSPGALVLKLILLTAKRPGEVEAMRWAAVVREGPHVGRWTLQAAETKGRRSTVSYLAPLAMRLLGTRERLATISPFVFQLKGKPAAHITPSRAAQRRVEAIAGIPPWTAHDLRRTAATGMRALGVPRYDVERILSHVDPSVTAVYDLYSAEPEIRAGLARWCLHVEELLRRSGVPEQPDVPAKRSRRQPPPGSTDAKPLPKAPPEPGSRPRRQPRAPSTD